MYKVFNVLKKFFIEKREVMLKLLFCISLSTLTFILSVRAHKLEILVEKTDKETEHEITKLGTNAKKFIKTAYDKTESELEVIKKDIESGYEKVKDFSEKEWKKFLELFKSKK